MQSLTEQYIQVRNNFVSICSPLEIEDYSLQAMPETSPAKWHLAHTSWFFETFILKPFYADYSVFNDQYEVMFNSYYNAIGEQFSRPKRHLLSRPTVAEVYSYREYIDDHMLKLLSNSNHPEYQEIIQTTILGINHEQQHQELFFTDLKYCLSENPLKPSYRAVNEQSKSTKIPEINWLSIKDGLYDIGITETAAENFEFYFDNELPCHKVYLESFAISDRLITNGEYLEFISDAGYQRPELWLSDGWAEVQAQQWQHPLYWQKQGQDWHNFTLNGLQPLDCTQPVSHISGYEADAFARWKNARLPTEQEWEVAANNQILSGQFFESENLQPQSNRGLNDNQFFGYLWQWTSSAYQPYPGFKAVEGAIGEYNGKFMCNQQVLRGGSLVTPKEHFRITYRNFFYPKDRWQFTGIRLAK